MENVKQKTFTIFLDIDGVLHTGTPLFNLLPNFVVMCYVLLERIGYRKIELVISSSWRHRGEQNVFSDLVQHDKSCYLCKMDELRFIALGNIFNALYGFCILPMGWL